MENFTAVGEVIRFGLGAVAKVGHNAVKTIIEARREKRFTSLWDFISRIDVQTMSRTTVENLIRAGAFDEITPNRAQLEASLQDFVQKVLRKRRSGGQYSLFDLADAGEEAEEPEMVNVPDRNIYERLEQEKNVMGIYISGHPFDAHEEKVKKYALCTIEELSCWRGPLPPKVGGIILSASDKLTKKGTYMGYMNLEDSDSGIELKVFPKAWETLKGQVEVGAPYLVEGRLEEQEPRSFIVEKLTRLEDIPKDTPELVRIRLRADLVSEKLDVKSLAVALKDCPGRSPVLLELMDEHNSCVLSLQGLKVGGAGALQVRLAQVVPPGAFEVA
jgi:DNA polymerase-3 subunit alpha